MLRRTLLGVILTAGGLATAAAHTPFRQWVIFRQRNLLILAERRDPRAFPLSVAVADVLAEHLPESRARPSRASDMRRLASLISTGQMEVAVMTREAAALLLAGAGAFGEDGPVALRVLFELGDHLLACRADFPEAHAYLVAATLDDNRSSLPVAARLPAADQEIPVHAGVIAYMEGQPPPGELQRADDADIADHDHTHPHPH